MLSAVSNIIVYVPLLLERIYTREIRESSVYFVPWVVLKDILEVLVLSKTVCKICIPLQEAKELAELHLLRVELCIALSNKLKAVES